jgi:hypothetical protein
MEDEMGGACSKHGAMRNAYKIFGRKPEGKKTLGRYRRRWDDNIKMDLKEVGFGDVDWSHMAQDKDRWRAVVNTVRNLWVP